MLHTSSHSDGSLSLLLHLCVCVCAYICVCAHAASFLRLNAKWNISFRLRLIYFNGSSLLGHLSCHRIQSTQNEYSFSLPTFIIHGNKQIKKKQTSKKKKKEKKTRRKWHKTVFCYAVCVRGNFIHGQRQNINCRYTKQWTFLSFFRSLFRHCSFQLLATPVECNRAITSTNCIPKPKMHVE